MGEYWLDESHLPARKGGASGRWEKEMHRRATYDLAVGLALRELHQERHAMRERVAAALEVSDLGVTRIETGEETLTAGGLILLLGLFDLSWEDFLERVKAHLPEAESEII